MSEILAEDTSKDAPLIKTVCGECVFAEYAHTDEQSNCKLGRLEKFRKLGTPVELVTDQKGRLSYEIGRFCTTARHPSWAKKQNGNLIDAVREEIKFRCGVVIYSDQQDRLENILITVKSLKDQKLRPASIAVVVNNNIRHLDIMNELRNSLSNTGIKWCYERIIDKSLSRNKILDKGFLRTKTPYTATFNSGYFVPSNFLKTIDTFLNDCLGRFVLLMPFSDINGLVVSTRLHNTIGGFGELGLIEKISELEQEQKTKLIVDWGEIEWVTWQNRSS